MKTKAKPRTPEEAEKLLQEMLAVGRKTMAESKKTRVRKTGQHILKDKLTEKRRKLIVGSLERHHRAVTITTQVCGHCQDKQELVSEIHIWSHSPFNGVDAAEITATIRSKAAYDFHRDIPLRIARQETYVPICASCIKEEYCAQQDN